MNCACAEPSSRMSSLGSGAAAKCAWSPGRRGPSPLVSSRVAMYSLRTTSFSGGAVRRRAQQDQPVDGARLGDGGVGRDASAQTAANRRHRRRAGRAQMPHAGKHVEVERRREDVLLSGPRRVAVAAEVDGQHAIAGPLQFSRLLLPTALVEPAPVRQHDAARARAVQVALDHAAVFGVKRDRAGADGLREARRHREGHRGADARLAVVR